MSDFPLFLHRDPVTSQLFLTTGAVESNVVYFVPSWNEPKVLPEKLIPLKENEKTPAPDLWAFKTDGGFFVADYEPGAYQEGDCIIICRTSFLADREWDLYAVDVKPGKWVELQPKYGGPDGDVMYA